MANRGYRAASALLIVLMAALALTSIVDRAGAQADADFNPGGLTLEAGLTGPDGTDIFIQLEGCPAGSLVRILVDGFPTNDYIVPDSGRLTETLDIPAYLTGPFQTVKAYCFDTQGFVLADIAPADDPDPVPDPDPDPDPGEGINAPDCLFFTDFSELNVIGDTFIAEQGYRLVALFYNNDPFEWDEFFDVETGDELQTSTGGPILKLALCGARGKPGYTPGELFVDAYKADGGANIRFTVIGCAAGTTVHVFVDGVWQAEFVVPANDQIVDQPIPTPADLPMKLFKAICGERSFGFAEIRPLGGGVQDLAPTVLVSSSAQAISSQIGEAVVASSSDATVQADAVATTADTAGVQAVAQANTNAVKADIVVPPFAEGAPAVGIEGSGQRVVVNPVAFLGGAATPSGSDGGSSVPQGQLGLGVLSAAGLLAFGSLRRVSRNFSDPQ